MSDSERPDIPAFDELEQLIRALGDEMAAWRRRAHEAEARVKEQGTAHVESPAAAAAPPVAAGAPTGRPGQKSELERENEELRRRLAAARLRTKQLVDRLRFLRQQHEIGGGAAR